MKSVMMIVGVLILPRAKIFPILVNFVKCAMWTKYGNSMKIEPQHERLPGKFPQGIRPGLRLWHLLDFTNFYLKIRFLNHSGALKDFRKIFFYGNDRINVWIQPKEKKNRFFRFLNRYTGWLFVKFSLKSCKLCEATISCSNKRLQRFTDVF